MIRKFLFLLFCSVGALAQENTSVIDLLNSSSNDIVVNYDNNNYNTEQQVTSNLFKLQMKQPPLVNSTHCSSNDTTDVTTNFTTVPLKSFDISGPKGFINRENNFSS